MKTKVSSWAIVLLSSMLTIFVLLCSGIALAYANGPGDSDYEDLWSEFFAPQAAESVQATEPNSLPTGIQIFKPGGTAPAEENTDYSVEGSVIKILQNDLTITGGSDKGPINARIVVQNENNNINQLTLEDLHIYDKSELQSTLYINCPNTGGAGNPDFTLTMKGESTIYQAQDQGKGGLQALRIEGGADNGFNIKGIRDADSDAKFEIYSYYMDAIFVNTKESVTFTGTMDALIYSFKDDGIDWVGEADHESLTIEDHARVAFGTEHIHKYSAIDAGSLYINDFASLVAICNNEGSQNVPAIKTIDDFVVNTKGFVTVDAYNESSWQAIDCNNLSIQRCDGDFTAIAKDYPAIVCHSANFEDPNEGVFSISPEAAPHVYLSGGFAPKKDTDHRAIRGAFTVQFSDKIKIPDGYLMYGSDVLDDDVDNITKRAVTTFSSGYALEANTPEFDVYTPVIPDWNGLAESKYAHSVVFREAGELIFAPGQKASLNNAGYRDCYKIKDTEIYFEDYEQKIPIDNITQWRSKGGAGYLNPLGVDFDAYRGTVLDQCDLMFDRGDRPEIAQLTNAAKAQIQKYVYDVDTSLSNNKSKLDEIYNQLVADTDALELPVPEPWVPPTPTPVNPENTGTSETGDGLPLWAGILLGLVAVVAGIVAWRKRELIKAKLVANGSTSSVAKTGFIVTLFGAVIVPIMLLLGLVAANAGTNTEAASSSEGINNLLLANPFTAQYNEGEYPGITITKDGQPATPEVDYKADPTNTKTILIKSNGLTVSGGSYLSHVDVSITTAKNVTDLTINNLYIDTAREWTGPHDGHTLILDWASPSGSDTKNFTLNVEGTCRIVQSNSTNGGSAIDILNEQGYGCNIHGGADSRLNVSSAYYESIFVHSGPLQFSGDLTAGILANAQRSIAWQEGVHDTDILALTDNVNVTCRARHDKNFSAVEAGDIAVLNNASFTAVNNNGVNRDVATVDVRYFFGVNTTGTVRIGNLNPGSWQAIKCRTLSILNCENFLAFSTDYTAVECTNALTIQTPNVVFCGEYNRELTQNKARRGAITVDDPTKVYIAPDIMAYGSQEAYDPTNPTNLAFLVRTAGNDVSETDKLYTPVVCDGNIATIAKTISFKQTAHSLELVPGVEPTYTTPGYKDYYYCKDCGLYYEDVQGTSRIVFIEEWMSRWGNGYIPAISEGFEPYRAKMIETCNNMYIRADVPEIHALVETAQTLMSGYTYNEAESIAVNKAMLDKVYYQLLDKVNNLPL